MSDMLKNALMSAGKKLLRTLAATFLLVIITLIPQAEEMFKQAAGSGTVVEKAVFGVVVGALVALLAFAERMKAQMDAQQKS